MVPMTLDSSPNCRVWHRALSPSGPTPTSSILSPASSTSSLSFSMVYLVLFLKLCLYWVPAYNTLFQLLPSFASFLKAQPNTCSTRKLPRSAHSDLLLV